MISFLAGLVVGAALAIAGMIGAVCWVYRKGVIG